MANDKVYTVDESEFEDDQMQVEEEDYEERKAKDNAIAYLEKLKQTTMDITNYQNVFRETTQVLQTMRTLIGVEDSRLEKIAEDLNMKFESIRKLNLKSGSGGMYEEPAYLLRQAMDYFEDRKEFTEIERVFQKILNKKLFDAFSVLEGAAIVNKAIEVMKEIQVESLRQKEQDIKDYVKTQIEALSSKVKSLEEMDMLRKDVESLRNVIGIRDNKIAEINQMLKESNDTVKDLREKNDIFREDLRRAKEELVRKGYESYGSQQPQAIPQQPQPQPTPQPQQSQTLEPIRFRQPMNLDEEIPATQPQASPQPKIEQTATTEQQVQQLSKAQVIKLIGEPLFNEILKDWETGKFLKKSLAWKKMPTIKKIIEVGFREEEALAVHEYFANRFKVG